MLTYFPPPLFGYQACPPPLRRDISQPLNNKSDTLGTSPASFLPFRQLNGPVMSSRSHDSRHDWAPVEAWLSLAWHRALLDKLPPGATLHSPRQPCLRSRLTYLKQYFLIQGRNGRAQIIVIMFSRCCHDDYVRYGAAVVVFPLPRRNAYLWVAMKCFHCCLDWSDWLTITIRYRERRLAKSVFPFEIKSFLNIGTHCLVTRTLPQVLLVAPNQNVPLSQIKWSFFFLIDSAFFGGQFCRPWIPNPQVYCDVLPRLPLSIALKLCKAQSVLCLCPWCWKSEPCTPLYTEKLHVCLCPWCWKPEPHTPLSAVQLCVCLCPWCWNCCWAACCMLLCVSVPGVERGRTEMFNLKAWFCGGLQIK